MNDSVIVKLAHFRFEPLIVFFIIVLMLMLFLSLLLKILIFSSLDRFSLLS